MGVHVKRGQMAMNQQTIICFSWKWDAIHHSRAAASINNRIR